MGFLDGYRVVDLTDVRGMLAGRVFADLGAEVVAVEPPTGGGEWPVSWARPEQWSVLSYNKKSVTCDAGRPEGRHLLDELCRGADFLLLSGAPAELEALDLGYERLAKANPGLIYVTMSPFGLTGPKADYADSDLIVWAASGTLSRNRVGSRVPIRISSPLHGYFHGAVEAVAGALLALAERARSGRGQHVDISFQNSMVFANMLQGLYPLVNDVAAPPDQAVTIFPTVWRTSDGYVQFTLTTGPATGHFSNGFIRWMDEAGMLPEEFAVFDWRDLPQTSGSGLSSSGSTLERFAAAGLDQAKRSRLEEAIRRFFLTLGTRDLLASAHERRLLLSPIFSVADVYANPHHAERGLWFSPEGPASDGPRLVGRFARTVPDGFQDRGGPGEPGSANADIYRRWVGLSDGDIEALRANGVI